MSFTTLFHHLIIGLVTLTSTGTLVHDNRLGRALEVSAPLTNFSINVSSHLEGMNEAASAHTHVERVSISQDFTNNPRIQPRDDHRKYYMSKALNRSATPDGSTRILWPSV